MEVKNVGAKKIRKIKKWGRRGLREIIISIITEKEIYANVETQDDQPKHKMGCLYENLWRWASMGNPQNQWEKKIFPIICGQSQETELDLEKSQNLGK